MNIVLISVSSVMLLICAQTQAGDINEAGLVGSAFDVAPFGFVVDDEDAKGYGVRWAEPRKIRRVVAEFDPDANLPDLSKIRLQYWHNVWNGKPDPVLAELGSGAAGWTHMDDWTKGRWIEPQTNSQVANNTCTFTFGPVAADEFEGSSASGVTYRKTLWIRIRSDQILPRPQRIKVYTESVYEPLNVRIQFGEPAEHTIRIDDEETGYFEVFNGQVVAISTLGNSDVKITPDFKWKNLGGAQFGLQARLLMTVDRMDNRYDRTIVTVRSHQRPFSFAADEVARGDRILVDDLGVLVTNDQDHITLPVYRDALRRQFGGKTVYDRINDTDEQTLARARNDMPLRRPMEFVHGLPGNRNTMQQFPNGDVLITGFSHWFTRPESPKDTQRKDWPGSMLEVRFGFPPEELRGGRKLQDGYLPMLRTWWQDGAIYYEQTTVMDKLELDLNDIQLDDPTVLLISVRVVNNSQSDTASAKLLLASNPQPMPYSHEQDRHGDEKLTIKDNLATAHSEGKERFRFLVNTGGRGSLTEEGQCVRWSLELGPGETHELFLAVPSITLDKEDEIDALAKRDFDADSRRLCAFWQHLTAKGTQVDTPEPWLNDFYKSHMRHLLVNCFKEPGSNRLLPHVGTFRYGVYANESVMMVSDLDRRGYPDQAQYCLDSWLQYQGTAKLPGNFKSKDGLFYGVNGHESGGYNKHHGYVMWGMAEHWWYTRDRQWMERAAPKLIKACEWVIRERQATMRPNEDGSLPIEYGFLPSGGLEDVQDFWYWLATNSATVWGFRNLADALVDFGHPEGKRLQREAQAYYDDFMRGITESRIRCPVVGLRDYTYVSKVPSRLYERGRSNGWIRETLEGAMFLPAYRLLPPHVPLTTWILKDYEDNLYISDRYGYSIPVYDEFWFSRGGFSMQANLLDGPLPYLWRDDIKHYVRAYFNSFASAFCPEVRMCNEHSLPELGYPSGDHFKTSDEAQSTYWLRLMFINEQGDNLYLGQALPRYWLSDGNNVSITRAPSHFGDLSLSFESHADSGEIRVAFDPPRRNPPKTIFLRIRHPRSEPLKGVLVNGQPHAQFDKEKEWIILPGTVKGRQIILAKY